MVRDYLLGVFCELWGTKYKGFGRTSSTEGVLDIWHPGFLQLVVMEVLSLRGVSIDKY